MLKQYKMVSIIYGGSGAKYAEEMNSLILQRSEKDRYPITSKIVMESVLTGDLLSNIIGLFAQTEFCLAFLTADDCCCKDDEKILRIRQNVVFELGMAIFKLGREKCILLSDFDPSDNQVELPSDFKGIDIKYFSPENRPQVFNDVLNKILKLSSVENDGYIPQYDNLLNRNEYYVNYSQLFTSCSHLSTKEGTAYLKAILNFWSEECSSFRHYEERCLYFLERVAFLPMFGRHKWVDDWFINMENLLSHYSPDDIAYCGKKQLSFIRNLSFVINSYTRLKIRENYQPEYNDYNDLLGLLLAEPIKNSGVINPLIATIYYDYLGLLYMSISEMGKQSENYLDEAITCFKTIMDDYVEQTDLGLKIWSGFVGFNLARCYLRRYHRTENPEDAKSAKYFLSNASMIRKRWLLESGLNTAIRGALSYEYFICKIEQISSMKFLENSSSEQIAQEFKRLEGELESYLIKNEQLERLSFVQELLKKRQNQSDDNPLAEKML